CRPRPGSGTSPPPSRSCRYRGSRGGGAPAPRGSQGAWKGLRGASACTRGRTSRSVCCPSRSWKNAHIPTCMVAARRRRAAPEDVPRSMLVTNPPEHTRLRALVSLAFTPRRVRQLAPRIETIAHELLDGALARRGVDLVETLAYPLPVVVIAELIGVPAEDRAQFKAWSNALVAPLGTAFFEVAPPERVATLRQVRGELEA